MTGSDGVQRIVGVILRPGNAKAAKGLATVLRGLVKRLRVRCPAAQLVLRGDSGFGIAEVLRLCDRLAIEYVLGVSRNSVLQELGTPVQMDAALKYHWEGDGCREFGEFTYCARRWAQKCRVIIKAEVTQGSLNPRYVVTSLTEEDPEALYTLYCARGDRGKQVEGVQN